MGAGAIGPASFLCKVGLYGGPIHTFVLLDSQGYLHTLFSQLKYFEQGPELSPVDRMRVCGQILLQYFSKAVSQFCRSEFKVLGKISPISHCSNQTIQCDNTLIQI
jgi:hypothetical protein|tara:strand:- start:1037 stop:1354 length:318 start_codon:yes stop_codon:yes gene_type:complete